MTTPDSTVAKLLAVIKTPENKYMDIIFPQRYRLLTVAQLREAFSVNKHFIRLVGHRKEIKSVQVIDNFKSGEPPQLGSYIFDFQIINDVLLDEEHVFLHWGEATQQQQEEEDSEEEPEEQQTFQPPPPPTRLQILQAQLAETQRRNQETKRRQQRAKLAEEERKRQEKQQQAEEAAHERDAQRERARERREELKQQRSQPPPPPPLQLQELVPRFDKHPADSFAAEDQLMLWWFYWLLGTHFMRRRRVDIGDRARFIQRSGKEEYEDRQLYQTTLLLINDMLTVKKENLDAISRRCERLLSDKGVKDLLKSGVRHGAGDLETFCLQVPSRNKIADLKGRVKKIVSKVKEQNEVESSGLRRERE